MEKPAVGVDVPIGLDWYWSLVMGGVIRGMSGPTAIHTKVGWILPGPATNLTTANPTSSPPTYTLMIDDSTIRDQVEKGIVDEKTIIMFSLFLPSTIPLYCNHH